MAVLPNSIAYYRDQGRSLMERADEMDAAPADYSAFQKLARQRRNEAGTSMLNALAAQFAGPDFQPVQAQYLKRAMAAKEPVNIGNRGYVGSDGEVVLDPMYQREKTVDNLRRRAIQLEQLAANAETSAEREAARREQNMLMNQFRAMQAETGRMNAETQRMMAEGRYGGRQAEAVALSGGQAQPKIITPEVQPEEAVGLKGVWQSGINKIADVFGAGDPENPNRIATERMSALGNQTQLYLQDAVPGRPSNYLLQMLEKQAIRPNQLTMGEAGGQARAQATIAVIETGLNDLANILNNPESFSKTDLSKARQGYGRLSQLKSEYGALLNAFDRKPSVSDQELQAVLDKYKD